MASFSTIVIIISLLFVYLPFIHAVDTVVEVTSLLKPLTNGGLMAIQCQIWNMQEGYTVDIFRFYNNRVDQITSGKSYLDSSLHDRVYLASRVFPDRTHVYVLTLVDVSYNDQGEYSCRVDHVSRDGSRNIATGKINIEIHSFPNRIYPECDSVPNQPIRLDVGIKLIITCASEKGVPAGELKWDCTHSSVMMLPRNTSTGNTVSSEVTLISDKSYHGAVFTCHLSSPGFPNMERTCHIGPITIHNMESVADNIHIKQPFPMPPNTGRDHVVKQNSREATGCNSQCSPEDEDIVLYLTISTIGASILCILFLSTTIICCCKYHSISTDTTETTRAVPGYDGSDPVYVSLQRRQEYDRNSICSTYMTVEDPNNPGSKVLMPKEVFEEFYRTLTIKRV